MLINEWQTGIRLNEAIQQHRFSDFSLWLAFLSPAVDESAQFYTPDTQSARFQPDLYQQLGIQQARPFSFQPQDEQHLKQQATAFQQGGAVALRLMHSLQGAPLVMEDNKHKLPDEVKSGLSLHARRHVVQQKPEMMQADPTALYEILNQLHA
ncbi:VC2046/SO_2500 family protein [Rheinheimera soli]|uniref:VC2046/SO_2500 family protein n=1 Tax=Rheinheimera soli TaxID=443616 RepID=UPI001E4B7380|nr:VC2046/SO_2500 family protein [Rheinheimera soli]